MQQSAHKDEELRLMASIGDIEEQMYRLPAQNIQKSTESLSNAIGMAGDALVALEAESGDATTAEV